ncbi:phytoene desaturase family protein, partial [Spirochaetota bacterium]
VKAVSTMFNFAGGNGAVHHKGMGSIPTILAALISGAVFPFHYVKSGSHELTHALVKAAVTYGVTIWPACPVGKILVKDGAAYGVQLSDRAVYGPETITAKKIVSNVSFLPTWTELLGEEAAGTEMYNKAKGFLYDENVTFCINMELDADPVFISADYDEGIQRAQNGWLGVESGQELFEHTQMNMKKEITNKPCLEWFVPTRVDPSQAPEGYSTASMLYDIPPDPKEWNGKKLNGMDSWDDIKEDVAELMVDTWDKYAPGFKKSIRKLHIASPMDIQRNNPSAVMGHMAGGAMIPSQAGPNRPLAGVCKGGASRTYIKDLYLSNSIHPNGQSAISSGYIAATEVAEDMGAREQSWWKYKAFQWMNENKDKIEVIKG